MRFLDICLILLETGIQWIKSHKAHLANASLFTLNRIQSSAGTQAYVSESTFKKRRPSLQLITLTIVVYQLWVASPVPRPAMLSSASPCSRIVFHTNTPHSVQPAPTQCHQETLPAKTQPEPALLSRCPTWTATHTWPHVWTVPNG